jgi:hypothetical protein
MISDWMECDRFLESWGFSLQSYVILQSVRNFPLGLRNRLHKPGPIFCSTQASGLAWGQQAKPRYAFHGLGWECHLQPATGGVGFFHLKKNWWGEYIIYCAKLLHFILFQSYVFHVQRHPVFTWYEQCVTFNSFGSEASELVYNFFGFLFMYGFPMIVIVICYLSILYEIYKVNALKKNGERKIRNIIIINIIPLR